MLALVTTRAVNADRNEHARRFLREVIQRDYDGNQALAAAAFGVAPSLLSEFLGGTRGAGMKLLTGIAEVTGASLDRIVGHVPRDATRPTLGNLDGWAEAEALARDRRPKLEEWVWECAREVSGLNAPPVADLELVLKTVDYVRDYPPRTPGNTPETTEALARARALKPRSQARK